MLPARSNKRVFIDTDWDTYETATLRHKTALRIKGGIRSEIINTEEKGTSVQILEQMDKWSKVRTEDGYMGYVPNSRLSKVEEETPVSEFNAPVYTNISMDGKVRLGFHQVTTKDANATFDKVADTAQGMNVIVPTWFNITDNEGNYTSLASKDYVDKAHALGIQVWAMFDNISTEESVKNVDSGKLFSSTATRKKLIENLMKEADTYGFDGFNLDFESLKSSAGPHYVQFIREMSVSCRQKGLVLSVDDYVPAVYSAFYNRKEQGIVADYVIVMGYDEHFAGGDAGSVASISYVENGITGTLKEVPKEKLINSAPKGVMLTDNSFNAIAQQFRAYDKLFHRGQKLMNIMPPFIAYGYACGVHLPLVLGFTVIIVPNLDPAKLGSLVLKYKPEHMFGVPAHYQQLAADPKLRCDYGKSEYCNLYSIFFILHYAICGKNRWR